MEARAIVRNVRMTPRKIKLICDLIRSRSGIETQTFQDALKQYAKRKDKNLRKLMRYAQMFRVEKLLRQYLEVLL